ncbi:MAG: restriction endonuclease subunit S [Candidatus Methanomarinus sp.]|uniref:Restriction endonuclease subunit S n=1 Tax=Candidatus Methanomarinus sp. TaxID=3386244 RepID=A0AC61S9Y0_9EURY|nr:type I restriction enzyme, S subunit [ANME-2 cluster archaeon]TKY91333.1 MAG: restriction endonuclease subunit S [ANME-2 cluster archaeon]
MVDALRLSKSEWQDTEFGKIPGYWKTETIGALSKNVTDGSHFSPKPRSVGKYMCSVKDMTYNRFDFSNCKLISQNDFDKLVAQGCKPEKNDILISKDGANCLDLIFVFDQEEDLVLLSSIAIVRLLPNIDPKFVCYFLLSPACQYIMRNNYVSGSAIPRVVLKDFKKISILLPPLPEQRAIASVLSSLDDKIDLLHRQNKTLEAMAEALFRQWFVEEADEEWEERSITELFEIRDGTHDSPKQKEIGKPLLTSKHILKNRLDIENAYLISDEDFENVNRRSKVDANDILFSMIGTIGLIYLEQSSEINYTIKNIGLFKTSQNPDWAYYTFLWLKSSFGQDFIHEHRSGSTQEYISLGSLRSIVFNCPPTELHREFNEIVNSYFNKININNYQIRTLEKLRDTLLSKLMSGKVRVRYER